MPHIQDTAITNIPTITGIMGDMATVITRPLGLPMVTAGAIIGVILLMDGIMVAVILLLGDIMVVVIEALAAFTVATGKTAIFISRISGYRCDNGIRLEKSFQIFTLTAPVF